MQRANAQMRASTGSIAHSVVPDVPYFPLELKSMEERVKDRDQILENLLSEIEEMKTKSFEENDEQLWRIMSRLEDIKREYEDILTDNNFQAANGVFQKKLAEIKAALLPLLSTSDSQTPIPEEEQEIENEIARFSEDFRLILNIPNWEKFSKAASKTHISNVISICGDTHVGKSTLIASLLSTEPGQVTPEVAQPQQNSPTTANVNCYDHPNFSSALGSVRLLDLEGENGGKPPKTAICTRLLALLDTMGVTEYQEGRRKAVAENLARLAFVVSDVVVYVWNESFANASYMKRVKQLAHDSTEGVDSATSPCLILVYNKCSLDEQFDIEKCTEEFFENVENLEIKNFYSEVKCVCIPHKDQMKKVRMAGKSTHYIDGEEIYALQIRKLADLLSDMMCKRMQQREANGCLFSESVWCILFKLVIERFQKKLRMGEILSNIMKPKHYLSSKAFDFFRQTYEMGNVFRPREFIQCREAAIQMLACLCVDHLKNKQEQFDKFIMNTLKSEAFQSQSRLMLADLLSHIDKMAPCEAIYPGSFVEGNSEPILCTQEKICHGLVHRTSHRISIPSSSSQKFTRLMENFQYWVGIGYRPTWEGAHTIEYPIDDVALSDLFLDEIEFLSRVLPGNYFLTRVSILQKAIHLAANRKTANFSDICWICLDHIANRRLDNCAHIFCIHCIEKLYSSNANQVPVEVNAKQEEESGFVPRIKNNQCPICSKIFHGTSPVEISSRSLVRLSEKFNYIFEY